MLFSRLEEISPKDKKFHNFEDVPVDEIEKGTWPVLKWACQPGDCIAFHGKTVHGAPGKGLKKGDVETDIS